MEFLSLRFGTRGSQVSIFSPNRGYAFSLVVPGERLTLSSRPRALQVRHDPVSLAGEGPDEVPRAAAFSTNTLLAA